MYLIRRLANACSHDETVSVVIRWRYPDGVITIGMRAGRPSEAREDRYLIGDVPVLRCAKNDLTVYSIMKLDSVSGKYTGRRHQPTSDKTLAREELPRPRYPRQRWAIPATTINCNDRLGRLGKLLDVLAPKEACVGGWIGQNFELVLSVRSIYDDDMHRRWGIFVEEIFDAGFDDHAFRGRCPVSLCRGMRQYE